MSNQLFFIHIDDKQFTLTKDSINNYPNSRLCKILFRDIKDPNVIFETNKVYINKDPKAFAHIVDIIRGYNVNINNIIDPILKHKIQADLEYFGLQTQVNTELLNLFTLNKLEIDDDLPELIPMDNTHNFDTSVLKSNDESKINKFMESLNDFLTTDPISAISIMSNDDNFKEYILLQQHDSNDSDTESLSDLDN